LDGDSYTTLISPAVVTYNPQTVNSNFTTPFIGTSYGEFAAPDLLSKYNEGDCIYAQFTVAEKQANQNYVTATNILSEKVNLKDLNFTQGIPDAIEYNYPLSDIIQTFNISAAPYYNGVFFAIMSYKTAKKNQFSYRLSYNTEETGTNTVNLYLQAEQTQEDAKSPLDGDIQAFDLTSLLMAESVGRDTTISDIPLKFIKANLKYSSKNTTEEGGDQPSFVNYSQNPITFYIFR
jgi:hypothetical protein